MDQERDILTPAQAADYLQVQVDRETIYRYIREGKLAASQLGRNYRIPKENIDLMLWATRTRDDIKLRDYTEAEITQFLKDDVLDEESWEIAQVFSQATNDTQTE